MDKPQLLALAAELQEACAAYDMAPALEASPERDAILAKARAISLAVTSPLHFTWTQIGNMYALASLRTAMHLGVLQRIPLTGSITVAALARQAGVQASLVERLLRGLVATQFLAQGDKPGTVAHTRLSRSYGAVLGPGMMFQTTYDDCLPGMGMLHRYLTERRSTSEPADQAFNPFTWSKGQDGRTVWDIMAETRGLEVFQMALATMDKKFPATGFFDFSALVPDGEPDRVVLVDVGGGIGRTLGSIVSSSPELEQHASRFILQDLESPVAQSKKAGLLPAGTQAMVHNMFEEQPVKGAKCYYLRRVLHDYSDEKCVEILKHLVNAARDDTVILISEMMVPPTLGDGELPIICMDMSMMNMGGKERSEKQWVEVLTGAGLELKKVWEGFGTDRLLETRLARPPVYSNGETTNGSH